eukprot:2596252-Karenia_brevis.AAC.1
MARSRRYTVVLHPTQTKYIRDIPCMYRRVCRDMKRDMLPLRPQHAIIGDKADVRGEALHWVRTKNMSRSWARSFRRGRSDFTPFLTRAEKAYVNGYKHEFWSKVPGCEMPPGLCFNLSDNPRNRVSWSLHGKIPTFRTGTSKMYFPFYNRFLTTRERLTCLGFPMFPQLGEKMGVPHINVDEGQATVMAGNAMHVANATAVTATALACVQLAQEDE